MNSVFYTQDNEDEIFDKSVSISPEKNKEISSEIIKTDLNAYLETKTFLNM